MRHDDEEEDDDPLHCAMCGHTLAWRSECEGSSHQTNLQGVRFKVGRFAEVEGVDVVGPASSEGITWFRGWQWRSGQCAECSTHIGWRFEREILAPFWALDWAKISEPPIEPPASKRPRPSISSLKAKRPHTASSQRRRATAAPRPILGNKNYPDAQKDRAVLACAAPECKYLVHSNPHLGGYCCHECCAWGGHGTFCERKVAPVDSQKCAGDWRPRTEQFRKKPMTHEQLRKYDEHWKQMEADEIDRLMPTLIRYFLGTWIKGRDHSSALACKKAFLSYTLQHGWTLDYSPDFFCELAYEGFFCMGAQLPFPKTHDLQIMVLCWDKHVHVLELHEAHISRQVRKRSKHYTMTVDTCFDDVLLGCVQEHGEAWLYRGHRWLLRTLHSNGYQGNGKFKFGMHKFELWDKDGQLVAGDLGYTIGGIYTSMTGFRRRHTQGAGEVQLVLMAALLRKMGFDWIDFGQVLEYKRRLGAQTLNREDYLSRLRRDRDRDILFQHDRLAGAELLATLEAATLSRWQCIMHPRMVVRQSMSKDSAVVSILRYGDEIESLCEPIRGWVKLRDGGGFALIQTELPKQGMVDLLTCIRSSPLPRHSSCENEATQATAICQTKDDRSIVVAAPQQHSEPGGNEGVAGSHDEQSHAIVHEDSEVFATIDEDGVSRSRLDQESSNDDGIVVGGPDKIDQIMGTEDQEIAAAEDESVASIPELAHRVAAASGADAGTGTQSHAETNTSESSRASVAHFSISRDPSCVQSSDTATAEVIDFMTEEAIRSSSFLAPSSSLLTPPSPIHPSSHDSVTAVADAESGTRLGKSDDLLAWTVVGGQQAGGVVVRQGKELCSAELGRLASGATVKQMQLVGERLHYEKISGLGPQSGWVSRSIRGKTLLTRVADK